MQRNMADAGVTRTFVVTAGNGIWLVPASPGVLVPPSSGTRPCQYHRYPAVPERAGRGCPRCLKRRLRQSRETGVSISAPVSVSASAGWKRKCKGGSAAPLLPPPGLSHRPRGTVGVAGSPGAEEWVPTGAPLACSGSSRETGMGQNLNVRPGNLGRGQAGAGEWAGGRERRQEGAGMGQGSSEFRDRYNDGEGRGALFGSRIEIRIWAGTATGQRERWAVTGARTEEEILAGGVVTWPEQEQGWVSP